MKKNDLRGSQFPRESRKKMHKLFRSFAADACNAAETKEIDLVFIFGAHAKYIFGNQTKIEKEKLTDKNKP